MSLPRDLSGRELVGKLRSFGYVVVRQRGSHIRFRRETPTRQSVTVPDDRAIPVGTLRNIVRSLVGQIGEDADAVIEALFDS